MFWKKNRKPNEDLQIAAPLILNSQSQMTGDFIIHTDVKIDGFVQGNVITTKTVIIGENGHLKGNLKCNTLIVFGSFEGISEVTESATLQSQAEYMGKLTAPIVSIFAGCRVNACINRDHEGPYNDLEPFDNNQSEVKKVESLVDGTDMKTGSGSTNGLSKNENSFLFNNLNK
ncbi:MAG: polymer-forming cytoskeletal protein [Prolixibacteraceae bacterium]|jgi:cytoskeletal protein CcmA (bactofilin family)